MSTGFVLFGAAGRRCGLAIDEARGARAAFDHDGRLDLAVGQTGATKLIGMRGRTPGLRVGCKAGRESASGRSSRAVVFRSGKLWPARSPA